MKALLRSALVTFVAVGAIACGPKGPQPAVRLYTDDYSISISFEPSPPRALEPIEFTIVVRDAKTGEPIERGEGRLFATNEDRKSVDNGLERGKELGTYHTKLMFVNAGPWAVGFQFRRDSTQRLQRTNDWMQEVRPEVPPGQEKK